MKETSESELIKSGTCSLRELIIECCQKMEQVHEVMVGDQEEIDRLQAETRAILGRDWKMA